MSSVSVKEDAEPESEEVQSILPENGEEELGSEISKSLTVIVKAVRHCGTQTVIHCDPNKSKEDFLDIIFNTKP